MIELVTFDFWQTLFAERPGNAAAAHALRLAGVSEALGRAGHPYDGAALSAADARALRRFEAVWAEHRDMTPEEQVRLFLAALDPALPGTLTAAQLAEVGQAYGEPVLTHPPVASAGAVEAVRWARARGLRLGVISNTGRTPGRVLRRLLERVGVLECFGVLSFSDEVGVRKPVPDIFVLTLRRAGVGPTRAVHLGDDPVSDVTGALRVGMHAIHYVPDDRRAADAPAVTLRRFDELPAALARLG